MAEYEEQHSARQNAAEILAQAKAAEAHVLRHAVPIYSETNPNKVVGHRLVRIEATKPTKSEKPEQPKNETQNSKEMKICTKCGEALPLTAFGKHSKSKDGLNPRCRYCVNEAFRENYAKRRDNTPTAQKSSAAVPEHPTVTATFATPVAATAQNAAAVCKHDDGKLRYDLCPPEWGEALAEVMTGGLAKYTPGSWRNVESCRYEAALMRHLTAWRKGEIADAESGLNHLKHVMANAAILLTITDK